MKKIIMIITTIASLFVFGCSIKKVVEPVLKSTYNVINAAENVITNITAEDFVARIQIVDQAAQLACKGLEFINREVIKDEETKENIIKAIASLETIHTIISEFTVDDIEQTKAQVLASLADVKELLKKIAEKFDIVFEDKKLELDASCDTSVNTLLRAMSDLSAKLK